MEAAAGDAGWEDLGAQGQPSGSAGSGAGKGMPGLPGEFSDTVTSAMVSHFARELTQGSMSLWPQLLQATARQYFNVTHGYVLRKALWLLFPLAKPKKKADGEIGPEKDWTMRMFQGLEVNIEAPDGYIPLMAFVTYVLLYCLIQGLQDRFTTDALSSTITFALVVLVLETTAAKGALFMAGAAEAPIADLAALLGYKFFHVSALLAACLLCGRGWQPRGAPFRLASLALAASCCLALWQVLRRLPRMQPARSEERAVDLHGVVIKVLAALQALTCWCLLPPWSGRPAASTVLTTVLGPGAVNATAR